ncbi:MAG: antibiotic biosynthesis monooxygenase family protein [Candidatus Hodarchaeales archaeon]|jgi:heme-degrading monooxygenase HmoA
MSKYVYIWEYKVKPGFIKEFEEAYNSQGTWVELLKRANGYLETYFFKDKTDPFRYVTVDYWSSFEEHQLFRRTFDIQFQELDKKCEQYTLDEKKIGDFSVIE